MQEKDVPQDEGLLGAFKEIAYATDQGGSYRLVKSSGWEAKRVANELAWQEIFEHLEETRQRVLRGELSFLAFHMERRQMDIVLLSEYTGLWKWRIRRHLKPRHFETLKPSILQRYAEALGLEVKQLCTIPNEPIEEPNS